MKKIFFNTLLCAAALMLGISCSKNAETGKIEPQLEDCSVSADVLGTDTKVALSGNTPQWQSGDQILVFGTDGKLIGPAGLFTLETGDGSNSGTFKGTKYFGQTPAYAIYPASVYATGKFTLPTAQDGTVTTAFESYAVMMGAIDGSQHIDFKNVCSIVKLNTGDYGKSGGEAAIKSVKLSAAASALTGEFTPNWTGTPSISPADEGTSQEVTVTAANAETGYATNTDIYIPIFPVENQAFSLKFTNTDGKVATVSETFAPAVNKIKDLGIAGGMEFIVDPDYWVDMGILSENGYPLYISKYNVQSITNDGEVTFAESETALGGQIGVNGINAALLLGDNLTFEGLHCSVLTMTAALSLNNNGNCDINYDNDDYVKITSKITGKELFFPHGTGTEGTRYYTDLTQENVDGSYGIFIIDGKILTGTSDLMRKLNAECAKLIIEDTNATAHSFASDNDFRVYRTGVAFPNWMIDADKKTCTEFGYKDLVEIKNDDEITNNMYSWFPLLIEITITLENQNSLYLFTNSDKPKNVVNVGGADLSHYPLHLVGGAAEGHVTVDGTLKFTYKFQCFVKGTLITLADGSKKPVEEITYDDELKVWNFDKGCYDSAKILWLTKSGLHNDHYIKCTFSDGTVLNVTGQNSHHKLYNYDEHYFQGVTKMEPGTRVFTENGIVTLVSKEWIEEDVEYYNLITDRQVNCFAEGVLTSARYNNTYPIDDEMKFVKDSRKKRPYSEFKEAGISREWYNGLRLGEQTDSLDEVRKYINKCESQMAPKPAPTFWQRLKTWWKSIFG